MFRITQQLFASQTINHARQHQAHLARLQRQISSGLRIEKPSDDPAAVGTLLAAKAKDLRYDVDLSNIEAARARLNGSVSQLTYAKELLSEAHTIALARENGEHQVAAAGGDLVGIVHMGNHGRVEALRSVVEGRGGLQPEHR